jgi:hypothetical protein
LRAGAGTGAGFASTFFGVGAGAGTGTTLGGAGCGGAGRGDAGCDTGAGSGIVSGVGSGACTAALGASGGAWETMVTGTELASWIGLDHSGRVIRPAPNTKACRATDPISAGVRFSPRMGGQVPAGAGVTGVGFSSPAPVSVIRSILVKPEVESLAITCAT